MLFNSIEFGLFLPIVLILYWLIFNKNQKSRNLFLLAVSYYFYGSWNWKFLSLIILSSILDFVIGQKIFATEDSKKRKALLATSVIVNLGFLGYFKYANFFISSFVETFSAFGMDLNVGTLEIILPVGISFYTFQTLSYTIDIYKRELEPTKDWVSFFAFVSFFPQLVAGPIERAKHLLPQFNTPKTIDYQKLKTGLLLIAGGLFKKIVIADRLAIFIDHAYGNILEAQGLSLVFATLFFAFQLYFDFSAYSEIAIGTAKMLDFDLSTNFRRPYLSIDFNDFWRRWHITLSSWFRDYVYIPLGGNRVSSAATQRNLLIVFLLSGLWHGASWNFVIWGALNGLFLVLLNPLLKRINKQKILRPISVILVFCAWTLSLVFFRAETFSDSMLIFKNLNFENSELILNQGLTEKEINFVWLLLISITAIELLQEWKGSIIDLLNKLPFIFRWPIYIAFCIVILLYGAYGLGLNDSNFIYFQF